MSDPRDIVHKRGLNAWYRNNFRGTLLYGTGSGKTYCGIRAMNHFYSLDISSKFLVVVPRIIVINNWKKELKKSNNNKLLKNITFICYNSINKYKDNYDLVILDEVHHCTSSVKMEFFNSTRSTRILGLTASLTVTQKLLLSKYIPIVDTYNLEDANKDNVVTDFTIYTIPVELTPEERLLYDKYSQIKEDYYQKTGCIAWNVVNKRSRLLYNAQNKVRIVPKISELFPDSYGVIFTLTIPTAIHFEEQIDNCIALHSKLNKKQQAEVIRLYSDGRTKIKLLSTPTMLDEGVTLPRISFGILEAGYSKARQSIQRIGRVLRLDDTDPDKHALVVRLYVKNTVEEKWVEESLKDFKVIKLSNYEQLRDIIKKES